MAEDSQKKEKVTKVQVEKNIGEEEAKKELAKQTVQEITGESAETNSKKVRDTLQIFDALLRGNLKEIIKEKKDIHPEDIRILYEHMMKNPTITDELARIGFGSDQLNVNAGMLKDRFDEVIKDIDKNGDAQQQEKAAETAPATKNVTKADKNNSSELFSPPDIPTKKDMMQAFSDKGSGVLADSTKQGAWMETTIQAAKGVRNIENAAAKTAGKVAGKVTEDIVKNETQKVLGNGVVGKAAGNLTGKAAGKIVNIATVSATRNMLNGGLG